MTSWRDVGTQQISGPLIQEICAPSRIRHVFIMPIPMVSSGLDSDSDQTSYRSYRCTRMILFASIRQGITARDIGWKVRDVCCDALTVSSLLLAGLPTFSSSLRESNRIEVHTFCLARNSTISEAQ
jgi:hypothetical protein